MTYPRLHRYRSEMVLRLALIVCAAILSSAQSSLEAIAGPQTSINRQFIEPDPIDLSCAMCGNRCSNCPPAGHHPDFSSGSHQPDGGLGFSAKGLMPQAAPPSAFTDENMAIAPATPPQCDAQRVAVPERIKEAAAAYRETAEYAKCETPGSTLNRFRKVNGIYTYDTSAVAPTLDKRREYRKILLAHREGCFIPQTRIEDKLQSFEVPLLDFVGFFIAEESYYPWCSGFKHGRHVITARHCFAQGRSTNSPVAIPNSMRFATFAQPQMRYKFSVAKDFHSVGLKFDPTVAQDDWIVLELDSPDPDSETEKLKIAEPKEWEEIIGIGIDTNRFLLLNLDELLGDRQNATKSQLLEPRVQFGPLCRITFSEQNLAFHVCGTDLGMSGAPILAMHENNRVDFVGVHVGGAASITGLCAVQNPSLTPNFGVVLPQAVREKLNSAVEP